ncbi:LysR family transcriptional regulator [Patulibacter sp. SYSU D01012]|uniref:LysR family transcriptional regulator n=1 Tax=Patulibacter sp. SYSU D01012 TaxID=2817381 RepID=UPI001B31639B|nr:LysR family transcriptional regulator [Patulibacter sp. SYSU D01012]
MERSILPSTHDLEAFVAAIESGTMGGAADALDLTQSAVTKRIARLEAQLGNVLLERGRYGVRPTAAGGVLYPEARRALDTLRTAADLVRAERAARHDTLRITASHTVGEYLVPDWLAAHRRAGGAPHATMRIANSPAVLEAVREGEADLGFVEHGREATGLETLVVGRDELVVVVGAAHRWAGRTAVPVRDLPGEPYLTREPASGTRTVAEEALAAVGVSLRPALEAQSLETVKRSVAGGDGFSLLSPLAVAREVEAGTLAAVRVQGADLRRELRAVRRRVRTAVPAAQSDPARRLWRWLQTEIASAADERREPS